MSVLRPKIKIRWLGFTTQHNSAIYLGPLHPDTNDKGTVYGHDEEAGAS